MGGGGVTPSSFTKSICENFGPISPLLKYSTYVNLFWENHDGFPKDKGNAIRLIKSPEKLNGVLPHFYVENRLIREGGGKR